MRGAPGNTLNNPTSYWVPRHSPRVFVERVDMVSGVGYDRAAARPAATRYHHIRRVVTDLGVLDFATPDRSMRLALRAPGGHASRRSGRPPASSSAIAGRRPDTREPTAEELG